METEKRFISGVVEGFYGRPWSQDERFDLFKRLKEFGLNTYMYAPKDDIKHRKCWRELYVETEQENLKHLIKGAEQHGISFVYALSPGLDIIFSCPKDIDFLKNKLKQVSDLGCKSFALLFDDIEQELSLPDKQDFESFADAQVVITNMIFDHLGKPRIFLFCPTEYCSTRAKPSVQKSEYLNILGKKLYKDIDILWTGPKVVSREIPVSSMEQVVKTLKRKPVIWDNSHSNDYDQRRIFLGPYDGRPRELYDHLNGVLSNPNCEFESNFIALYTVKSWVSCCKGNKDVSRGDYEKAGRGVKTPYEEETEGVDMESDDHFSAGANEKHVANKDNVEEMEVSTDSSLENDTLKKCTDCKEGVVDDVKQEMEENGFTVEKGNEGEAQNERTEYDARSALNEAVSAWLVEFQKVRELKKGSMELSTSPAKLAITDNMNSLSEKIQKEELKFEKKVNEIEEPLEQLMDAFQAASSSVDANIEPAEENIECCTYHTSGKRMKMNSEKEKNAKLRKSDLLLLIDLFYLPYEHGEQAKFLVSEFKWLQANVPPANEQKPNVVEIWKKRAAEYHDRCQAVADMFMRISHAPNKPLVQELYPYIWDVKEVAMLLNAFIKWLGSKTRKCKSGSNLIPEDPEPWLFKGGIAQELECLLSVDMEPDVTRLRPPLLLSPEVYTIRPYLDSDKKEIYKICKELHLNELNKKDLLQDHPELEGDSLIGPYIRHAKDSFFVVEDEDGLCGYCVAALDSKDFNKKAVQYFAEVSSKYKRPVTSPSVWNRKEILIESLYNPTQFLPENLFSHFPAHIVLALLPRVQGCNIGKRLLTCLISILKANGVKGVHSQAYQSSRRITDLLSAVGFSAVPLIEKHPDGKEIVGRNLKIK